MVAFGSLIGTAALFVGYVSARPTPDSSSGNEVAVSAVDGVFFTNTAELSAQLASEAATAAGMGYPAAATMAMGMGAAMGSGMMGESSSMGSSGMMGESSAMGSSGMMGESSAMGSSGMMGESSMAPPAMAPPAMAPPAMAPPAMYPPAMAPPAMAPPAMAPPMATPPPMMTDSVMMTNTAMASATASASLSGATMAYGSGSSSWSSQSYQNCVQQCVASFGGAPPSMSTAAASGGSGSSGSGVTHTVIVAPTQGVLRFVPFATEANPGDVVEFQWHANNHTVTKSSQLTPCNKTSDAPFATGQQNMPFTFQQVVNDTSPTFFYCGTPGHCEKGMFGIINPPSVQNNANTSVASMMPAMVTNYSSVSAMNTQMMNLTAGNSYAANWGSNIDMSQMPSWSQQFIAENVMYTRSVLGMNPDVVQNGLINVGASPLMVPQDLAAAAPAASSASAAASKTGAASTPASSAGGALSPASSTNGAGRAVVSGGLGVVALAALFLAL